MEPLLRNLELRLGRFAIPHLTILLIAGQVLCYLLLYPSPEQDKLLARLLLIPNKVLAGEYHRIATFLVIPPMSNPFYNFFAWYLFYLMGTTLEHHWGVFRYNVFLGIGIISTIAVSFLQPNFPVMNGFVGVSVFLAFALLYPNFEIQLMFLFPIKVRYLALLSWLGIAWVILTEDWSQRLSALASVSNVLLFFHRRILQRVFDSHRKTTFQRKVMMGRPRTLHCCAICGVTEETAPRMEFRFCTQCVGDFEYCAEHLTNHAHREKEAPPSSES